MENSMEILNFIPYSNFNLWDVNRYANEVELISIYKLVPLYLLLYQSNNYEKIQDEREYYLCGLSSYGNGLFHRDIKLGKEIKGSKLNQITKGQFIYSRLGANNGSFDIVNEKFDKYWVTNEFPTFNISNELNSEYLKIIFRLERYWKIISRKLQGAAHKRFKEKLLLDLKIPLPPLHEQNRLVANYNAKIQLANKQEQKAKELESSLKVIVDEILGIRIISNDINNKLLNFVNYKNLEKWGINAQSTTKIIYLKDFPIYKISDIANISSGGTPARNRKEYYNGNIPWIKTGEVINDIIYDTEEKITQEAIKNSSAKLYKKGSLLIAMYGQGKTRGRTAKLGVDATTNQACAVIYDIDNTRILTDFLWIYLMNEYDRLRELASGNNQPNLNAQMIKSYPVIVPPKEIQQEIIDKFFFIKQQIKDLKNQAEENREKAIKEFENEIFEL